MVGVVWWICCVVGVFWKMCGACCVLRGVVGVVWSVLWGGGLRCVVGVVWCSGCCVVSVLCWVLWCVMCVVG